MHSLLNRVLDGQRLSPSLSLGTVPAFSFLTSLPVGMEAGEKPMSSSFPGWLQPVCYVSSLLPRMVSWTGCRGLQVPGSRPCAYYLPCSRPFLAIAFCTNHLTGAIAQGVLQYGLRWAFCCQGLKEQARSPTPWACPPSSQCWPWPGLISPSYVQEGLGPPVGWGFPGL